jgi:hypothetical protein
MISMNEAELSKFHITMFRSSQDKQTVKNTLTGDDDNEKIGRAWELKAN